MTLLKSSLETLPREMVLLAPALSDGAASFHFVEQDPLRHRSLLHAAQRLRARIYLSDGAIEPWQLTQDGRHEQHSDFESWHLLALDQQGSLCGCARYHLHPTAARFHHLSVRDAAAVFSPEWRGPLQHAIERELATARCEGLGFAELGGWALAAERRCTPEALRMALATYALAQMLGGALGVTTATVRHHSSWILRRLGGRSIEIDGTELPSYYDPRYRCEMEILKFDSRSPGAYTAWVERVRQEAYRIPVVWGRTSIAASEKRIPVRQPYAYAASA